MDIDEFTVENAFFKSFDIIVRSQLDPIWHRVSFKTKQLVNDLKTLRNLLRYQKIISAPPSPSNTSTFKPL